MDDLKMDNPQLGLPPYVSENPVMKSIRDVWRSFSERREALGLSNPGRVEDIAREVQRDVFLSNSMFTGLRADFTRPLSFSPLFQYSHNFSMGSPVIPPYGFMALFGTKKVWNVRPLDTQAATLISNSISCKVIWTTMVK